MSEAGDEPQPTGSAYTTNPVESCGSPRGSGPACDDDDEINLGATRSPPVRRSSPRHRRLRETILGDVHLRPAEVAKALLKRIVAWRVAMLESHPIDKFPGQLGLGRQTARRGHRGA